VVEYLHSVLLENRIGARIAQHPQRKLARAGGDENASVGEQQGVNLSFPNLPHSFPNLPS
jgi:hypothetical protein